METIIEKMKVSVFIFGSPKPEDLEYYDPTKREEPHSPDKEWVLKREWDAFLKKYPNLPLTLREVTEQILSQIGVGKEDYFDLQSRGEEGMLTPEDREIEEKIKEIKDRDYKKVVIEPQWLAPVSAPKTKEEWDKYVPYGETSRYRKFWIKGKG